MDAAPISAASMDTDPISAAHMAAAPMAADPMAAAALELDRYFFLKAIGQAWKEKGYGYFTNGGEDQPKSVYLEYGFQKDKDVDFHIHLVRGKNHNGVAIQKYYDFILGVEKNRVIYTDLYNDFSILPQGDESFKDYLINYIVDKLWHDSGYKDLKANKGGINSKDDISFAITNYPQAFMDIPHIHSGNSNQTAPLHHYTHRTISHPKEAFPKTNENIHRQISNSHQQRGKRRERIERERIEARRQEENAMYPQMVQQQPTPQQSIYRDPRYVNPHSHRFSPYRGGTINIKLKSKKRKLSKHKKYSKKHKKYSKTHKKYSKTHKNKQNSSKHKTRKNL